MWCIGVCLCVYPLPNTLPNTILILKIPSGPPRGGLLQIQVYLKLFLVYLMNGCLSKEQAVTAENVGGTLMCVFKGENEEYVITISAVIREFLLLEQVTLQYIY